jgi:hypothetical protein
MEVCETVHADKKCERTKMCLLIECSELVGFLTLSVVWYSKENMTFPEQIQFPKGTQQSRCLPTRLRMETSSFQNVLFSSFLEYWTMDKVQKPSNSECYTRSSEPFRIYQSTVVTQTSTADVNEWLSVSLPKSLQKLAQCTGMLYSSKDIATVYI